MGLRPYLTVIALGHTKGVGKDTIAKSLCLSFKEQHDLECQMLAFAYPVKEHAFRLYVNHGLRHPEYYDSHLKEKDIVLPGLGLTPRQLWIKVSAVEADRDDKIWFNKAIECIRDSTEVAIFTDLRYMREAKYLQELKSTLDVEVVFVKVIRDGMTLEPDGAEEQLATFPWDIIIHNDYNLTDLLAGRTLIADEIMDYIAYGG